MLTVKLQFEESVVDFRTYLLNNTWMGALDRVRQMPYEEVGDLLNYLSEMDVEMTEMELNDFIWFEWDDIKNELPF